MTTGLLIDTDPALGLPLSDVDDALAVHFAVRAGLPVAGLTSCYGNAPLADTHTIASHLGRAYDVPVHRGAAGPADDDTPAVRALLQHTGTVLALAPLTNIASALLRGARWERLVVLGGSDTWFPNLHPLHTTEYNFKLDPGAAAIVLPRTDVLFPMEVCRQVQFHGADVDVLPDWLRERCRHWIGLAPLVTKHRGFHPWDVLPAMWLSHPDLFELRPMTVELRRLRGYRGHVDYSSAQPGSPLVALQTDASRVRDVWHQVVSG